MKNILSFVPGFRSNVIWKKIIASIYYLFSILLIAGDFWAMLFFLSIPFIIFGVTGLIKSTLKKESSKKYVLTTIIAFLVFTVGINNLGTTEVQPKGELVNQIAEENDYKKVRLTKEDSKEEIEKEESLSVEEPRKYNKNKIETKEDIKDEVKEPENEGKKADERESPFLYVESEAPKQEPAPVKEEIKPQKTIPVSNAAGNTSNFDDKSEVNREFAYIGNKNTRKFHYTHCSSAKKMSEKNRVYLNSRERAINGGYNPCGICHP